jgi:glycosyltransferase involved in cell wall biosynthesis
VRIAFIIPRVDQLGPVKVVQSLVNQLCKIDNLQINVFYLDKKVDLQVKFFVSVEQLDSRNFSFNDYDIIHTNGIRPDFWAFRNRRKIRFHISTIHNFVFDDLTFTYNRLVSLVFGNLWLILWRRADKLVCVSNSVKSYYEKWYPSSKLNDNGITTPETSLMPDDDIIMAISKLRLGGKILVGSAGQITRRKGLDQLLYLAAEVKDIAIVVIGEGSEHNSLILLAKKLNIRNRCLFCGFRNNAANYFRYFDFFIMPSRSEGFGLALVEAVQQKVSVICSDINVFKELFTSYEVTFFNLEDRNSLIEAFRKASEPGKDKVVSAYARYLNNYTDSLMAKKYYNLYQSSI